jgi:SAM-dependent methyltransferase
MTENKKYTDEEVTGSNIVFHDEFDAKIYDWKWGKEYSKAEMEKIVSEYNHYLEGGLGNVKRYLDIGCGTGTALVNLSLYDGVEIAHGSDISIGMLKVCRKNAIETGGDSGGVILTLSDASKLPYRDESFDFITCHAILHHVPNPKEVLREVYRLLRPGGRALVFEPTKYGTALCFKAMRLTWGIPLGIKERLKGKKPIWVVEEEFVEGLDAPPDLTTFAPKELRTILGDIPFSVDSVRTYGFLGNLTKWFFHPLRNIRPIKFLSDKLVRILTRLDEGILKKIVPETLYFQAVISLKK